MKSTSISKTFVSAILSVCLIALSSESILAQANKQVPKETLRSTGTILRIAPGFLQVKTKDGGQWIIKVPDNQENISVIGSAESNWLQRGMYVRFTGLFDKRGKPAGSINQLQVFSPDKNTKIGVFPDSGLGLETTALFSSDEPEDTPKPAKQPDRSQYSPYLVAGRLAAAKGGKLSVLAGRTLVQAQLAENVKISVTVSNAGLARIGDTVELEAWYPANQKAAGKAIATRLKVTASKPYSRTKRERPARKPATKKPEAKPEKADEKKEPENPPEKK
jgi:hypothetical protein